MGKEKDADARSAHIRNDAEVEFEHPTTGERYGATYQSFKDLYEPVGFKVTRYADGTPIDTSGIESPPDVELIGPQGPEQPAPDVPTGETNTEPEG